MHERGRHWSLNSSADAHEDFEILVNGWFDTSCPPNVVDSGPIPSKKCGAVSSVYRHESPTASKKVASKANISKPQSESLIPAARSYRKETAELIKQLDVMLLCGNLSCATNTKRKRKNLVENQARPRSRNVVLKLAADMIWKLQCDEEVLCVHFVFYGFDMGL